MKNIKKKNSLHFRELLKNSFIAFVLKLIGIVAGYVFTLLITRNYGPEALGIYTLSYTLLQITSIIGRLGMDITLLRFVAEYSAKGNWEIIKELYRKALKLVLPFSLFVSILTFLLSPYIAIILFNKPYLEIYFRIASIGIVPLVLLFIHTECLRGLKKIKEYMFFQQSGIFILASIILGILILSNFLIKKLLIIDTIVNTRFIFNLIPILVYIFSIFLLSILAYRIWKKQISANHLVNESSKSINNNYIFLSYSALLSYSIPILFSGTLSLIMGWSDSIMLGIFRTEYEVGIYSVVVKLSMITSITLMAVNTIAAPKFAEFWGKKDIEGLANLAYQATKVIFWTSLPIVLLFLIFPTYILGIFGEDFKAGATALRILTIGQFINVAAGSVGYILQMTGHQTFHQKVLLIGTIINILLNWILIPNYGMVGAAISNTICLIFWNILFSIKVRHLLKRWVFYPNLGGCKW